MCQGEANLERFVPGLNLWQGSCCLNVTKFSSLDATATTKHPSLKLLVQASLIKTIVTNFEGASPWETNSGIVLYCSPVPPIPFILLTDFRVILSSLVTGYDSCKRAVYLKARRHVLCLLYSLLSLSCRQERNFGSHSLFSFVTGGVRVQKIWFIYWSIWSCSSCHCLVRLDWFDIILLKSFNHW